MTLTGVSPATPSGGDPRDELVSDSERDVRPIVERPRSGLSGVAIGGIATVAALGLFAVLEARRQPPSAPATMRDAGAVFGSPSPPPLYIPPLPLLPPVSSTPTGAAAPTTLLPASPVVPATTLPPRAASTTGGAAERYQSPVLSSPDAVQLIPATQPRQVPRNVSGQSLVLDASSPISAEEADTPAEGEDKTTGAKRSSLSTTRARAAMFANRSTTVPQGTLIPAVLETAFDSTSPGFARALVQKDVRGFDGTRVLIPRGSRLIGEYGADTAQGQKRAVILWSRLIRPDGVTIAIGSPAADPVGRGGVKADVNSHFLERFSGAILQSAFDLGITLAARSSRSPVIVALPGAGSRVAATVPAATGADIPPTLRVPAGRSVSVFVARDLDFTEAEGVR